MITEHLQATLDDALQRLEPMNTAPILLAATRSDWTAVFSGHWSWPESEIAHMSKTHRWRGLLISYVEDTYDRRSGAGRPGGTQFVTYGGPNADPVLNVERIVEATNQIGRWEFYAEGVVQPFETVQEYKARRVRDRFTPQMLEGYCMALGVTPFDPQFYGPSYAIIRHSRPLTPGIQPDTYHSLQDAMKKAAALGRG